MFGLKSALTPDRYNDFMISARPRILIKVTFLKHLALEVWVSIFYPVGFAMYVVRIMHLHVF